MLVLRHRRILVSLLTGHKDQGRRSPFGNLLILGSLKKKTSHLPVLVHNRREQTHGMWLRERDPGLEGSARRSCRSPVPVCSEPAADPSPQEARAGW